jgi:hypothetical protein
MMYCFFVSFPEEYLIAIPLSAVTSVNFAGKGRPEPSLRVAGAALRVVRLLCY